MNDITTPYGPDPLTPGAPIIPRDSWDLAPYSQTTFPRVREYMPTALIRRGDGPPSPLPERTTDVDGIEFASGGARLTVGEYLDRSFTNGFIALSEGYVVAERYANGFKPQDQHLAMSMTKSITATVCGVLVGEGLLDPERPVTYYLPELDATAYRGANVQHLLDMTAGVRITGPYTEPGSHQHMFLEAAGWRPKTRPEYPGTTWEFLLRLTDSEAPHGTRFHYRSPESNALGFVMQRASGQRLAELFSSELWAPLGAECDAYITVDHSGFACTDGGFNATLRDYARFALMHLRNGEAGGVQIVPAEWIVKTRRPDRQLFHLFRGAEDSLPQGAYHNQFWIEDDERSAYMCRGNGTQLIYMDPRTDFAVVKLSSWADGCAAGVSPPAGANNWVETMAAVHALRDAFAPAGGGDPGRSAGGELSV